MKTIGFSGSREGMSHNQRNQFINLCEIINDINEPITFIHGDCIGADKEAHDLILNCIEDHNLDKIKIFPPIFTSHRAYCFTEPENISEPKDYLQRDRDIVDACDILIATPLTNIPKKGSGTWYTINYAKKKGIKTIILAR